MSEELRYNSFNNSTIQTKLVEEFIELHDSSFQPKISSKVSISKYAEKLCDNANIITCKLNSRIVGMCAYYCQPDVYEYGFLSYLAVDENLRGSGIGKKLISEMVIYCKTKKMKGIKTSTWESNMAIGLYLSFGFKIVETKENRVELKLEF